MAHLYCYHESRYEQDMAFAENRKHHTDVLDAHKIKQAPRGCVTAEQQRDVYGDRSSSDGNTPQAVYRECAERAAKMYEFCAARGAKDLEADSGRRRRGDSTGSGEPGSQTEAASSATEAACLKAGGMGAEAVRLFREAKLLRDTLPQ